MASFQDDLEASWAHLELPVIHHKRIRTTNLVERAIEEQRRRTKVIPRFFGEKSCLKLAFACLWQTSQRWQPVRMSDIERAQLERITREIALLPTQPHSDATPPDHQSAAEGSSRRSLYSRSGT